MKKLLFIAGVLTTISFSSFAQQKDSADETAKKFIHDGDYLNAIVVLNHSLQQDHDNLTKLKDLSFAYYLQRNYSMALETAKPLVSRADADVECYQILGLAYKAIEERKDCEKMYKEGIRKFPNSGVLYNEYGEMLWTKQNYEAIKLWEKGIETDPNYSSNYYNASKFYYFTLDKVWSLIYGEIFVNLESYSKRTNEIKQILADSYKKLFSDIDMQKNQNTKNEFVRTYLAEINKQSAAISTGITPENLTLLRRNFATDWAEKEQGHFPFRLFDYHNQLIKLGLFNGYNQWLLNTSENYTSFQAWTKVHPDEYNGFINYQKGRIFKLPIGQYYHALGMK